MSTPGFIVTLEGHPPTISTQLPLLPLSPTLLCLPALPLPPTPILPPHNRRRRPHSPLPQCVRDYIHTLHLAHVARLSQARAFLSAAQPGENRWVFLNGGFAAAQTACLGVLRDMLVAEGEGGPDVEKEAEWVWGDVVAGGVQGLFSPPPPASPRQEEEEEEVEEADGKYGVVRIGHVPDIESLCAASDAGWRAGRYAGEEVTGRRPMRVVSAPRNPTLEEIAAGVEICKASVAVAVRGRGGTAAGGIQRAGLSPPPSPTVRTEFVGRARRAGEDEDEEDESYILPPLSLPTPPSSAGANSPPPPHHHHRRRRRQSSGAASAASATPSSTADISGATIRPSPSPHYLSGFDAPLFYRDEEPAVEPLFPSVGECLLVYVPFPDLQRVEAREVLERALGDWAVGFIPQTPGAAKIKMSSPLSPPPLPRWSYRSSLASPQSPQSPVPLPQLGAIPTITATFEKSPAALQNELRALLSLHFPPAPSPPPPDGESSDCDLLWLLSLSTRRLFSPVLSSGGSKRCGLGEGEVEIGDEEGEALTVLALCAEEAAAPTSFSQRSLTLRHTLATHLSALPPPGTFARIPLTALFTATLATLHTQHPGAQQTEVLQGSFLLPELERYSAMNPYVRVLALDVDLHTGSTAILELQRVLGCICGGGAGGGGGGGGGGGSTVGDVLQVLCIADGTTQYHAPPTSTTGGISVRTSINATTRSYTLGPAMVGRKPVPRGLPKTRLVSRADVVVAPGARGAKVREVVDGLGGVLGVRMRGRGREVRGEVPGTPVPGTPVVGTPGVGWKGRWAERERAERAEREMVEQRTGSYYDSATETDEEDVDGRRASFRRRVKNGSKALKWLGLE